MEILRGSSLSNRIEERLSGHSNVVVCGVGNDLRGDDGVGLYFLKRLLEAGLRPGFTPLACGEVPENYLSEIVGTEPSHVIIIDGANVGQPAGTIVLVESDEIYGETISTHRLPLSFFARMLSSKAGRSLDVFVIGIQIASSGFGESLSPPVRRAADSLVELFSGDIRSS